jgi:hypothetical protein
VQIAQLDDRQKRGMPMSEASLKQAKQVLDLLSGMSTDEVQNLIKRGDLVKMLAQADVSRIDSDAFAALLKPPVPQPSYTAVSDYVARIMARSELRGWGFTQKHADSLSAQLEGHDHAGPLAPVGVKMWLGRDLTFNWAERIAWLKDIVAAEGLTYYQYLDSTPTFHPGSEIKGNLSLAAAGLDLSLWHRQNGLVPNEVRAQQSCWPSLEVPDLLCLNPSLMHVMDGENFPFLMAPGLVVGSDRVPLFARDGREVYVFYYWAVGRWYFTAMVRSREL